MKYNSHKSNSAFEINDDLDYLADAGQDKLAFNPKELEELNKRIQNGGKLSPPPSGIILSLIMIMITATIVFLMNVKPASATKKYTTHPFFEREPHSLAEEKQKSISEQVVVRPVLVQYNQEHYLLQKQKIREEEIPEEIVIAESIEPIQVQSISLDTSNVSVKVSEFSAPVYEIMGYKITNYHRYYFNPKKNLLENQKMGTENKNAEEWNEPEHANSAVKVLQDALSALRTSNYPEALQQFEILLELNREDENAVFYSGLCCFFNKKYAAAIDFFVKTESNSNKVFLEEARFYRAMALQYSGNESAARLLFIEIANEKKFYSVRAAEFLK
jgi:hypothetical protein